MNLSINYATFLNFPQDFLTAASKYYDLTERLSKRERDKYKIEELREIIDRRIEVFKDTKYLYQYSNELNNTLKASNYQPKEVMTPRKLSSPQEDKVDPTVDRQIWANKFYYALIDSLSTKLTREESIYFIDSYFRNRTEDEIASKIGICPDTLQKYKISCLIKLLTEVRATDDYYSEKW